MEGSGRTYEAVSHPYYYLTASLVALKIDTARFNVELQKSISWDLRCADDSNIVCTRSSKNQEMQHFSDGKILFYRYYRTKALRMSEAADARALLTEKHIGRYDTSFHVVHGLSGDKNAISIQSVELENFYLSLIYISSKKGMKTQMLSRKMTSYFHVRPFELYLAKAQRTYDEILARMLMGFARGG